MLLFQTRIPLCIILLLSFGISLRAGAREGGTWEHIDPYPNARIMAMRLAPSSPTIVYVDSDYRGMFRTAIAPGYGQSSGHCLRE